MKILGELEQVVMLAILRLGETAYGVNTRQEIERCTGRSVARGALYVTLDRLEEKGLIRSRPDTSRQVPSRGGRPRRYLDLSAEGLESLRRSRESWLSLWNGIEPLLDRGE